jgi:TonB family protein
MVICRLLVVLTLVKVSLFSGLMLAQTPPTQEVPSTSADANHVAKTLNTDPQRWARIDKMVLPNYPSKALQEGIGGMVDVEVVVDINGRVKRLRAIDSLPKNRAFELAVEAVSSSWTFKAPVNERCVPYESIGGVQFAFSVEQGGVKIATLNRREIRPEDANDLKGPVIINRRKVADEVQASFPRSARQRGAQASLGVYVKVDPITGEPIDIEVSHIVAMKEFEALFKEAATSALRVARFAPAPEITSRWHGCLRIDYRLSN